MEKKELIEIIKQEKNVEVKNLQDILKLSEEFPYCELFPIIYINEQKKLSEDFISSLKKFSININNRAKFIERLLYFPEMKKEDFEQVATQQQVQNEKSSDKQEKIKNEKKYDSKFDEEIYRRQSEHHKSVLLDIIKDKVDSFSLFSKNLQKAGVTEDEFCKIVEENALNNKTNFNKHKSQNTNTDELSEKSKIVVEEQKNVDEIKEEKNIIEEKITNNIEIETIKSIEAESVEPKNITEVEQETIKQEEETKKTSNKEVTEKTKGILSKIEELRSKKLLSNVSTNNNETIKKENNNQETEIEQKKQLEEKEEIKEKKQEEQNVEEKTKFENIDKIKEIKTQSAADKLIEKLSKKKDDKTQIEPTSNKEEALDLELINNLDIQQEEKNENILNNDIIENEIIEIDFDKISKQIEDNKEQQEEQQKNEIFENQVKSEIDKQNETVVEKIENIDKEEEQKTKNKEIEKKEEIIQIEEKEEKIELKEKIEKTSLKEIEQTKIEQTKEEDDKKSAADKVLERLSNRKKEPKNIIDEFMEKQPSIDRKKEPTTQEDLSEKSVKEMEIVTERLAEIYVLQGLKDKAIEVYEKLILKYPEKSVYFAQKIEELKK